MIQGLRARMMENHVGKKIEHKMESGFSDEYEHLVQKLDNNFEIGFYGP